MYSLHTHTDGSNASRGFSDSSIKIKDLVKKAKEIGLKGIAITNHEICSDFIKGKKLEESLDFDVLLGNEIYLVSPQMDAIMRENYDSSTMYYPHFILIALDEIGNRQIRELSTLAWKNSYYNKGIVRTTTLTTDLEKIVGGNKGHVVSSSACLGSSISRWILDAHFNPHKREARISQVKKYINWLNDDVFGKGYFFLEMQPPATEEQRVVNDELLSLSNEMGIDYIITTDVHYLGKDKFELHKSFLNSSDDGKDREVDDFYKTTYLMDENEIFDYFRPYWSDEIIQRGIDNTDKIGGMATRYSFKKKSVIPRVILDKGWESKLNKKIFPSLNYTQKTLDSPFEQDRYLMYLIQKGVYKFIPEEDYKSTFDRIEEELAEFWNVSEKLEDRLHGYFVAISKLVDIMWNEGDSIVGAGRGSGVSSIIDYLLEITQLNPLKMPVEMPFYRFVNRERPELADLDIDTQSDRRAQIFNAVKDYFESFGGTAVNCCTYGTLTTRSAILTACRGLYISSDEGMAISSLVPMERGEVWSFDDTYFGNEEKGRKKIKEFINLVDSYENLYDTIKLIEGLVISRGTHASGVFIVNDDFNNYGCMMRSPDGSLTSQWDLHESEEYGLVKVDFLTTSALSKIRLTMEYLIEHNLIEKKSTLKETYLSYINPMSMNYDTEEVWDALKKNIVPDLFQFDSVSGSEAVRQIKPCSLIQLAQSNSLMRLQQQPDATESPTDKYIRYKENIELAYKEMDDYNVPKKDQIILEKILKPYYFVADTQEVVMQLVKTEEFSDLGVKGAHAIRKGIAKKSQSAIDEAKKMFYEKGLLNGADINTLNYIWDVQIKNQLKYSFSILHTMAYTFIALQELVLFTQYPSIYWNTACLNINSGSIESENEKQKSTKYGTVAKAIGDLQQRGVVVQYPDINESYLTFKPDEKNNRIMFGLNGINGIGSEVVSKIIEGRPYNSLEDFISKTPLDKSQMVSLIKAGTFDSISGKERIEILKDYFTYLAVNEIKKNEKLNMQNFQQITSLKIVPLEFSESARYYNFLSYVDNKKFFSVKINNKNYNFLDEKAKRFFERELLDKMTEGAGYLINEQGEYIVCMSAMKKLVESTFVGKLRERVGLPSTSELLYTSMVNRSVSDNMAKYCEGTISKWEMDSISYYYHEHELANVNKEKYNISSFNSLPENPEVVETYKWKGRDFYKFKLDVLIGTVLDKNKNKHIVSILTADGVVNVKFYGGSYAWYDKQLSEIQEDGSKKITEKSWFSRGSKIMVIGYRRDSLFIPQRYTNSVYQHSVMKIINVNEDGSLDLKTERN